MLGFTSVSPVWIDVSARQRQIGRALRRQFETIVAQATPEHMLELLRNADARFTAATGREVQFAGASPTRLHSINIAMAIVGVPIVLWAFYDIAMMALSDPRMIVAVALPLGLATIFAGAVWLIEGK